jgi:hypothetical protein
MYIVSGEIEHIYISYQNLSRWQIIILKILYLINENDSVKACWVYIIKNNNKSLDITRFFSICVQELLLSIFL